MIPGPFQLPLLGTVFRLGLRGRAQSHAVALGESIMTNSAAQLALLQSPKMVMVGGARAMRGSLYS
jgi:hypothetical protein